MENIEVQQRKPKILYWSDWGASTGFATVGHEIIPRLQNMGFDCVILGINYKGIPPSNYFGLPVYPCLDPRYPHGENQIMPIIQNERPDILITLNDFDVFIKNQFAHDAYIKYCKGLPWLAYFPIDGEPLAAEMQKFLKIPTQLVCYSEYAKNVIHDYVDPSLDIEIIHHGVDTEMFKPLPPSERSEIKKSLGLGTNFVIGRVDRNQPRKNPGAGFEIFSYLVNGANICECGQIFSSRMIKCPLCGSRMIMDQIEGRPAKFWAHMMPQDVFGDLSMLTYLLNCREHVIFPGDKICSNCQLIYPVEQSVCSFCGEQEVSRFVKGFNALGEGWPRQMLAKLVGCFDVRLSTTYGEGWGLNDVEALACGVPVISTDCAASTELLKDHGGIMIEAENFVFMPNESGLLRPHISRKKALFELIKLYEDQELRQRLGRKGREFAETMDWNKSAEQFKDVINKILFEKEI